MTEKYIKIFKHNKENKGVYISFSDEPENPFYSTTYLGNLLDFEDNVTLSITNLITCRDYWLKQYPDISNEVLTYYILGSYNKGISGFTNYLNEKGKYITGYAEVVLNYKMELEQLQLN